MNVYIHSVINSYYDIRFSYVKNNKNYDTPKLVYLGNDVYDCITGKLRLNGVVKENDVNLIYRYKIFLCVLGPSSVNIYLNLKLVAKKEFKTDIVDELFVLSETNTMYSYHKDGGNQTRIIGPEGFLPYDRLTRHKFISYEPNNIVKITDINTLKNDYIKYKYCFEVVGLDIVYIDGKYYELKKL